jgi:hypothetical protein
MPPEKFVLSYQDAIINVEIYSISGQPVYRVIFGDKTEPLVLHRATHFNTGRFWTSIPEGRQVLAEEIGVLIEKYLKQK